MPLSRGSQQALLGEAAAPPLWAWGEWAEAGPEVPPPGAVGIQGEGRTGVSQWGPRTALSALLLR